MFHVAHTDNAGPVTPGERLYLIRLACGDGLRKAESMAEFVGRVARRTGERYHPNAVSLLERNQQQWRLLDVRAFAAVDPLNRGEIWLSTLSESASLPVSKAPPADERPTYIRVAEQHGGEVAKGSREAPGDVRKKPTKRAASGGKKPKR
jgi:hypothetical protein